MILSDFLSWICTIQTKNNKNTDHFLSFFTFLFLLVGTLLFLTLFYSYTKRASSCNV